MVHDLIADQITKNQIFVPVMEFLDVEANCIHLQIKRAAASCENGKQCSAVGGGETEAMHLQSSDGNLLKNARKVIKCFLGVCGASSGHFRSCQSNCRYVRCTAPGPAQGVMGP